jgi:hypothetical protein
MFDSEKVVKLVDDRMNRYINYMYFMTRIITNLLQNYAK